MVCTAQEQILCELGEKGPRKKKKKKKKREKGPFHGCCIATKTFENL